MNTAASSTKKGSPSLDEVKKILEAMASYVSHWTEQELQSLSNSKKMPYIWPIEGLGYVIGHYRVLNNRGIWQVRDKDNNVVHSFSSKQGAVFYTLCETTGRFKVSGNLLLADSTVNRLKNDIIHFEASIKRAKSVKDFDRLDIWKARMNEANLSLRYANEELQKSLNSAKYIKYWE
jgi:hypothetical protein